MAFLIQRQVSVADAAPEEGAFDARQVEIWESEGGREAEPDSDHAVTDR
jgi:hypothetical protein